MNIILLRTDVSKLKKQEILTYLNQTVQVVEMHQPATLQIDVMLNKLKALKPELEMLPVSHNDALAETTRLQAVNAEINNALRAILNQSDSIYRMRNVSNTEEVAIVLPFVERYIKATLPEILTSTVNICNRMLVELNATADLKLAVTTVGLKAHFDEVKRLIDVAAATSSSRIVITTQREKSETMLLKSRVSKCVSNLLKAIEVACEVHEELDYEPLKNGLNVLNTAYRAIQKAKETRWKSGTLAKSETTDASSVKTIAAVA
ncbi:MAG: hypothetical protein WCJ61_01790 [Paludibacter sp.]